MSLIKSRIKQELLLYKHSLFHNCDESDERLFRILIKNQVKYFTVVNCIIMYINFITRNTSLSKKLSSHIIMSAVSFTICNYFNYRLICNHFLLSIYPAEYWIIRSKSPSLLKTIDQINSL